MVTNALSTYNEKAKKLLAKNVLLSNDLDRYAFEDDVVGSGVNIAAVESTIYAQAGTCGNTESGSTIFSEKILSVKPIKYNLKYCWEDLQTKGVKIDRACLAKNIDSQWQSVITEQNIGLVKSDINDLLWVGSISGGDIIDGWFTRATASSTGSTGCVRLDSTYSALVQSAITIALMGEMVQNFCDKIIANKSLYSGIKLGNHVTIHMAPNMYDLYRQYLISKDYRTNVDKDLAVDEMWVNGYERRISIKEQIELDVALQTSKPKMIAVYDKNLVFGSSLVSEIARPTAKWIHDELTGYVYFQAALRLGTQIVFDTNTIINY